MGIPISLAGAMGILWAWGATINLISLFGLIMVLGIVVDDAIVVGEAIYVHRKMGKPPVRAAVDGISEVGLPVIAAVITTIVAFVPLAFMLPASWENSSPFCRWWSLPAWRSPWWNALSFCRPI